MPLGHAAGVGVLLGVAAVATLASDGRPVARLPSGRALAVAPADCRVSLHGTGTYRLTVQTGGPVPVVDFKGASGPRFDPIQHFGNFRDCDQAMGDLTVRRDRSVTPLLFHVANELYHAAATEWRSSRRPQIEYAYRDFGNLASEVSRDLLLMGFRQTIASIATDLITRYANPAGYLTNAGAKWVAETAVKMMMESYVEGKDPGLIIDGLLTRMVDYLQGHAETLAGAVGGDELKAALKPQLTQMADAVKQALIEVQPDGQTVDVTGADNGNGCTHFLQIHWNFKGGTYRGHLQVQCGRPPSDWISRVVVRNATVEPGETGAVTAQALSQLGVPMPMPLASATSAGIAPVQPAGAGEPAARLAGPVATFDFTADEPRADKDYDVRVNVLTDASSGRLAGLGHGLITVKNVAPEMGTVTPGSVSAEPGEELSLGAATLVVIDRNADPTNPGEVDARSIKLTHPDSLMTQPLFDATDTRLRLAFDGTLGRYQFGFTRRGRVESPHPHGTWPLTVTIADEALSASTTIALTVEDVVPTVDRVTVTPAFVHRNPQQPITVTLRVADRNGAADLEGLTVDATAAGGRRFTIGDGLQETARGEDWIEYQAETFMSTTDVGEHRIPVEVIDEVNRGTGGGTLHVGNLAPVIEGYGMIFDADSVSDVDHPSGFVLVKPKGLCPGDHFSAGPIASDPEGDALEVVGEIVETGTKVTMRHASGSIWIADMTAPDTPGEYTVRITVSEVPPDKSTSVEMKITVIDCGEPKEDPPQVGLAVPANADDVAAAPRDRTTQLMFGAIAGGMAGAVFGGVPAPAGGGAGPSAELLADSLALLLGDLEGNGLPPVETYVLATGGSTGPVAQMFAINRSGVPLQFAPQAVVLEPVSISPAIQARVTGLLQRFVAAGGQAQVLNAYCLEFLRKPPAAGTLMRIASADIAAPFAPYADILDAAERVRDGIGLHPDSDPTEYLHAIRQWSIWTAAERFDPRGFADAFVATTRRNLEAAGQAWTDELEQAVRELAPNRWTDVQAVLREAGIPEP